jgi:hypothetical protein
MTKISNRVSCLYGLIVSLCLLNRICGLVVRDPGHRSRGPGFDFRHYQILWQVVGPLSLVNRIKELLGGISSDSGLENREYGRGGPRRWPRYTLYPQALARTSSTSSARSVGTVCSRNFFSCQQIYHFSVEISLVAHVLIISVWIESWKHYRTGRTEIWHSVSQGRGLQFTRGSSVSLGPMLCLVTRSPSSWPWRPTRRVSLETGSHMES